jgi:hypothetical protein
MRDDDRARPPTPPRPVMGRTLVCRAVPRQITAASHEPAVRMGLAVVIEAVSISRFWRWRGVVTRSVQRHADRVGGNSGRHGAPGDRRPKGAR